MDLKVMPKSHKDHKFILCIIDAVTNFLISVPIYHTRSEEIDDALIENVISKYSILDCISSVITSRTLHKVIIHDINVM